MVVLQAEFALAGHVLHGGRFHVVVGRYAVMPRPNSGM